MRIIPAILTNDRDDFQAKIERAKKISSYVQIDIMDGKFVPNVSLFPRSFAYAEFYGLEFEAHLMVKEEQWEYLIQSLKTFENCRRIYIHYEVASDSDSLRRALNLIESQGQEPGIALNPKTSWQEVVPCLKKLDALLFMGVNPGFYGSEFQPEVLDNVRTFLEAHRGEITVGWDGGADANTLPRIVDAGAEDIAVGSALFGAEDIERAYEELKAEVY